MLLDLSKLEEIIFVSFLRSNVLSIEDARSHAGLAVDHVRMQMCGRTITNPATFKQIGESL
jgi:hypothetical protein